jgi:DNA-binding NarL/FixJ family response regulator
MPDDIRIAIQHRLRLFREGLRLLFEEATDTQVVGTAVTASELLDLSRRSSPDVVVVEVADDGSDVLRSCARLSASFPDLRFVGIQAPGADPMPARAAGLYAVVPGPEGFERILEAVRASLRQAPRPVASGGRPPRRPVDLTSREVDVLSLVGAGHTSQEISERLAISRKTVESHKQRIFAKLDVQNQAHAVAVAVDHGLIAPDHMIHLGAQG